MGWVGRFRREAKKLTRREHKYQHRERKRVALRKTLRKVASMEKRRWRNSRGSRICTQSPYTTRDLFSRSLLLREGWDTREMSKCESAGGKCEKTRLTQRHCSCAYTQFLISSTGISWTSWYRHKYCGSSPGLFCCSATAHVPMLFISLENLTQWMDRRKLQHSTHLHCRAGSERNFFPISWGSRIKKEKRLGVWTQEKSSKLHNFRVLRELPVLNFAVS